MRKKYRQTDRQMQRETKDRQPARHTNRHNRHTENKEQEISEIKTQKKNAYEKDKADKK